ncbi:MAG: TolC family protein [Novosphingobium sp.]|nr:TolC family protein [Novosphingobium sp.]
MSFRFRAAALAVALALPATVAIAESVSLDEAIAKALEVTPIVRANDASVAATKAGRVQAGVKPNPTVTVQQEDFFGTGPIGAFNQAQFTVTYGQMIERGGKRQARVGVADGEIGLAEASARVARLNFAAEVQRAFIDVFITREVVRMSELRLATELEIERKALRRVRGYKDPLFVETRAAGRVAQAKIDLDHAKARFATAKNRLASFWGADGASLEITGNIGWPTRQMNVLAEADDDLARAEIKRSGAVVTLERTRSTQDYHLSGGVRYLRGLNSVALVGGITIPLGRYDRNQGGIARAEADRQRLEFTAEAARQERLRRLEALNAEAEAALARADAIMREVWPRAVKTLAQVREGYNRGGFNFRDVEAAADAITQVQAQWLAAITQFRDLQTEIDRLTGRFDVPVQQETNP